METDKLSNALHVVALQTQYIESLEALISTLEKKCDTLQEIANTYRSNADAAHAALMAYQKRLRETEEQHAQCERHIRALEAKSFYAWSEACYGSIGFATECGRSADYLRSKLDTRYPAALGDTSKQ